MVNSSSSTPQRSNNNNSSNNKKNEQEALTTTPSTAAAGPSSNETDLQISQRQRRRQRPLSINDNDPGSPMNDDNEQQDGNVVIHDSNSKMKRYMKQQSTPSSWADGGRRYQRESPQQLQYQKDKDNLDVYSYKSAPPPRTTTPVINNLSYNHSISGLGTQQPRQKTQQQQQPLYYDEDALSSIHGTVPPPHVQSKSSTAGSKEGGHHPDVNNNKTSTSFKGWLAEGIVDILNAAAGVTLSTTATILSPPIALTRDVVLPAMLAIIVDTLDNVTPTIVQDWFRIITSSLYHLVSVLKSTHQGKLFRKQLILVLQNFIESVSAPEARQVVVDSMATGIKLADALQ